MLGWHVCVRIVCICDSRCVCVLTLEQDGYVCACDGYVSVRDSQQQYYEQNKDVRKRAKKRCYQENKQTLKYSMNQQYQQNKDAKNIRANSIMN